MVEKGKKIVLNLFHLLPSTLETKVDRTVAQVHAVGGYLRSKSYDSYILSF